MTESGQSRRSSTPAAAAGLADLRDRIDSIDSEILARLNERARVVQEVGRHKQASGSAVYSAGREQEIVARLAAENSGPFPDHAIAPVFREIVSATRALEEVLRVAYLGPEGTFSHLAATQQFGASAELVSQASIADVFGAVARGQAHLGVIPVENTTDGIVTQSYDLLPDFEGTLCGELLLRVSHDLFSLSGRRVDVKRVISHPQPLAQCRGWLDRNLPDAERLAAASTTAAARMASEDESAAAICGRTAGLATGLRAIETAIEDRSDNTTRFLLLGNQPPEPSGNDLTSLVFTLRRDESGALHRLLEPFARTGVNLTSLQLRPIKGKPWEYVFFLDIEGHPGQPEVREALSAASSVANSHRVLGSFPRATPGTK
ncbi:MAG: prephenate dehydratase [Deltaproteobacteria bacterium]|nr:prephenate dehydratase [Deltaproteobacteria bacterium]MBW2360310.1 prephenate dehydratase [Deltaproteobacteria bacterium]